MENRDALEKILKVKQGIEQMDLLEFKTEWRNRSADYARLSYEERLKYMVMSIKILHAKTDLKRMINSIQELMEHPESERALFYYLRADLWKFLDNFHYILLIEDLEDFDTFECLTLLDGLNAVILQDENLRQSSARRLKKLVEQTHILKNDAVTRGAAPAVQELYQKLEQRISQILHDLTPEIETERAVALDVVTTSIQKTIQRYTSFSISRISIERSGVLSILQLLSDYPEAQLEAHCEQLQETLSILERRTLYEPKVTSLRNQSAYALIVLLEILKIHKGLPVLLSRILDLCSYLRFASDNAVLEKELRELKGRVAEIAQKKLRPILDDVLWKNPTYLTQLPHIRFSCPWCYSKDREDRLDISNIRQVVTWSFDCLEAAPGMQYTPEGLTKSRLSEMVIESLGLLVNLEPSPRFLKLHAEETRMIKQARKAGTASKNSLETILQKQYQTYNGHLKFLEDSIEYYKNISEQFKHLSKTSS